MYRHIARLFPSGASNNVKKLLVTNPGCMSRSRSSSRPQNNWLSKSLSTSTVSSASDDNKAKVSVPSEARVVICGGGVVGASVAYHLAEKGWTDVVLLEQGSLTCGTTWHAAGMIGRIRHDPVEMRLVDYSRNLYEKLEKEEYGTGWKECGSLNVARTKDRLTYLKYQRDVSQAIGIKCHIIDGPEIHRLCPHLYTDDLVGGLWVPNDGVVSAPDVCMAMAKVAKENGVQVFEGVAVDQVKTENGRVTSVKTSHGDIKCDVFVNCAGQWARFLGQKTVPDEVAVPLHSCEHYYVVTKAQEGIDRMMPVVRDYDGFIYLREWNGGMMGGGFEPGPKTCFHDGVPDKFEFQLLPEDWDQFQVLMENIVQRMPSLENAEIRQLANGPESFTSDGCWLAGPAPMLSNYYIAAGMNSKGIAGSGGLGRYMAEWIVNGRPSANLWVCDPRRFTQVHCNKNYLKERIPEALTKFGTVTFPNEEYVTGRNIRCSPLHSRLEASGAVFGQKMAYETPLYFTNSQDQLVYSFTKQNWFDDVRSEVKACREAVGIMDLSSYCKIEVSSTGNQAEEFLQYLCCNDVGGDVGSVVNTGMLNEDGGFENDCTVVRLERNRYHIISLESQQTRAMAWLKSHSPPDDSVRISDVTSGFSGIALVGPHAHQLLAGVSDLNTMSTPELEPMTSRAVDVGHATGIRAIRFTHTGEDGFALYIPSEYALHVYDTLMSAGKDYGIRNAGFLAQRHLRVEGFLADWGLDLDDMVTPLETGQDLKAKFDSDVNFLGKAALLKQRESGVGQRFAQFLMEPADFDVHEEILPWGGEPIYRNGEFVGLTTTCAYGFSQDKMICQGFIGVQDDAGNTTRQQNIDGWVMDKGATYEIVVAGKRIPVHPSIQKSL